MASEVEPPKDKDPAKLDPEFFKRYTRFEYLMGQRGWTTVIIEGLRTAERQAWLYASSRSRPGPWKTNQDGIRRKSRHQSGKAADVWAKTNDGKTYLPNATSKFWKEFESCAIFAKLRTGAGYSDANHLELAS